MTETLEQKVNAAERYIHLMTPSERILARSLVAADFDVKKIARSVWNRAWSEFPGIDRSSRWKLPFLLCGRVLSQNRDQIRLPDEVKSR